MRKLLFLLLLLPFAAKSQIIYGLQQLADGVKINRRILLPIDSTLHTGSHLVWMNGVVYGLGADGFYYALGTAGAGPGGTIPWDSVTGKPTFSAVAFSGTWISLTSKPTTVATAGLTDAVTTADTSGRWLGTIYKSHDSVFFCKGITCTFAFKDTAGGSFTIDTTGPTGYVPRNQMNVLLAAKVNVADSSTSPGYLTFARYIKVIDSLNLVIVQRVRFADSATNGYTTFARAYKIADSLGLLINKKVNIADSAGAGYATFARLYKVKDSLLALITAGSGMTKAGPLPYLKKVGTDSATLYIDSVAYYLGQSSKKFVSPWQYSYDNFWTATTSNGFQVTGVTAALTGNKIALTGTTNNYLQKYQKSRISYFEHVIMEDTIVLTSAPGATTSIGIGIDNIANLGRVDLSNTGTAGKAYIVTGTTDKATSSGNITFAQFDTIVLKFQQMRDTLAFTVTNKANATTANVQLLLPNALQVGNTDSIHVAGQFSIFVKGSSADHYTLVSQRISVLEPQGTPLVLFGDSKYEGGYVSTWNARTADRLRALGFNVVQLGSSGSSLSDLYNRLQDLTSLYPSQVILQGYSNDIRQGLSAAQAAVNYENLKDLLESYGFKVWVLTAPETGSLANSMRLFDSTVRQRYPLDYIPVYDAMVACGSACLTADLIHWTDRGNDTVTKVTARTINNPLYNQNKPTDLALRTEFAKTKNNLLAIGANLSYLAASGNFVIGHNTTSPVIIKAKGRTTTFGYATNAPWIRFTSESGASSGDIISDSLGNTGMGINAFLTTPTGQNNVLFGRAVAALQNASNNRVTAVGSFANNGGGTISAYDVSNGTFFGFEAGYYENTPNKGYIANSRSSNLFYNDYSARKLIVYPSQTGTSVPVFLTTDQFQVNGSSYFLDSVRFSKVPDATLSTDSIAFVSNNGSGNNRTLKKAAVGPGLVLAAGVLSVSGVSDGLYLPTNSTSTNVASVSFDSASYTKIGNTVTGRISGSVTATTGGLGVLFDLTVPVTNINWNSGAGTGQGIFQDNTTGVGAAVRMGFSSATTFTVQGLPATNNIQLFVITFSYDAR